MKICIAGKNKIAITITDFLLNELNIEHNQILIITNQSDSGINEWQPSFLKYAQEKKLKVQTLEEIYHIEDMLFLSLEFDKIIKPNKFKTNKLFNIHFSLLPQYKGMYTSIMPILNNEKYTGVTLHKIDKGIDTGDIIAQIKFKIDHDDNSRDLYFKYLEFGINLVKRNINNLLKQKFSTIQQNKYTSSYYSKISIDFHNIKINLRQTAIHIHNQIRAYNFREYQIPTVKNIKIISSKILASSSNVKTGDILFENDISLVISTIDNDIVLYKDLSEEFLEACKNGDNETINNLMQIPKIINIQNTQGWTPLIVSIFNNQKEVVKTLLINGANAKLCNFNGTTTLMYAKSSFIQHKDPEILNLLLNLNMDIYQKDIFGKNILGYCKKDDEKEALNILKNSLL